MDTIEIISGLNTKTLGFGGYSALKHKFDFQLEIGSIVRLTQKIKGADSRSHWTIGLYRVYRIGLGAGTSISNENDARFYSYWFDKIKKDGTLSTKKFYGWNCQSFDYDILTAGIAERVQ